MTPSDLDTIPLPDLAALCGLTYARGYATPCPLCGATQAHAGDRRGALLLRPTPATLSGAWTCCACNESGSRLDLLCLAHTGARWRDATPAQRDHALGRTAPPARVQEAAEEPRRYLTPEEAQRLLERSWEARADRGCQAWAHRRGLWLTPDLRALPKEPDPDLSFLWSKPSERYPEPAWLPGLGYRLWMPTTDTSGEVRGGQLRNTRPDIPPSMKERGAVGVSSAGLCYADFTTRQEWAQGRRCSRPVVVVEGGPDRLAARMAWGRERTVIGIRSGSFGGWCELLHPDTVMITHYDAAKNGQRQGDVYGNQLVKRAPHVRLVSVLRVYEAAGLVGGEGLDLSSPEMVGRWPAWGAVAP